MSIVLPCPLPLPFFFRLLLPSFFLPFLSFLLNEVGSLWVVFCCCFLWGFLLPWLVFLLEVHVRTKLTWLKDVFFAWCGQGSDIFRFWLCNYFPNYHHNNTKHLSILKRLISSPGDFDLFLNLFVTGIADSEHSGPSVGFVQSAPPRLWQSCSYMGLKWRLFPPGAQWSRERKGFIAGVWIAVVLSRQCFIWEINKNLGQGADASDLSAHQDESAQVLDEVTNNVSTVSPLPWVYWSSH